ncbi:MAG: monovalent cation/H(+) antiporter subunit G [Acidimicrobiales bacterium]
MPGTFVAAECIGHDVALGLVALGTAVIVASVLGALAVRGDELTRLHYLSPLSSLGVPLLGAGVCVARGWGIADGEIILVLGIFFFTGPAMSAATARLIAEQDGMLPTEGPE